MAYSCLIFILLVSCILSSYFERPWSEAGMGGGGGREKKIYNERKGLLFISFTTYADPENESNLTLAAHQLWSKTDRKKFL